MLKLQMFILCDCNLYHCTVTKCASCASWHTWSQLCQLYVVGKVALHDMVLLPASTYFV